MRGFSPAAAILVLVLLVFAGIALLYAYRAQAPAVKEMPYAAAVAQVEQGLAQRVVVSNDRARITLRDGKELEVRIPERDGALRRAVIEWNQANPSRTTELRDEQGLPTLGLAGSVVLSLLPIALLGLLILLAARQLVRANAPDRYEALSRLADLRDRGVLSEDEFQREKKRLLG